MYTYLEIIKSFICHIEGVKITPSRTSYEECDGIMSDEPSHMGVFAELDSSVLTIKRIIRQVEFCCVGDVISHIDGVPVCELDKTLLLRLLQQPEEHCYTVISRTDHINACAKRREDKTVNNKSKFLRIGPEKVVLYLL